MHKRLAKPKTVLSNRPINALDRTHKQKKGKRVVVFGTFDRLHKGHINFLKQARQFGDELYIIVARDNNAVKIKGRLPNDTELRRVKKIKNLKIAKRVMLGQKNFNSRYNLLNKIRPHIVALGYDQQAKLIELRSQLKKYGMSAKIVRLKPYHPEKYKTSKLNNIQ